jgi:hypothetical protein
MQRAASFVILSLLLLGCGDDEPAPEPRPNCAIGVTLTGDVEATFSTRDEAGCGTQHSFDSGLDVAFIPARDISGIDLRIDEVTESETGGPFPTRVIVTTESVRRYGTTPTGCAVELTEHDLERTEDSEIGEQRHYRVAGTGSCSEPAVPTDMMGQVSLSDFTFFFSVTWRD